MKNNKEKKLTSFLKSLSLVIILLSSSFLAVGDSLEGQLNFLAGSLMTVSLGIILFTKEVVNKIINKKFINFFL